MTAPNATPHCYAAALIVAKEKALNSINRENIPTEHGTSLDGVFAALMNKLTTRLTLLGANSAHGNESRSVAGAPSAETFIARELANAEADYAKKSHGKLTGWEEVRKAVETFSTDAAIAGRQFRDDRFKTAPNR